jgi:hypothetical protein
MIKVEDIPLVPGINIQTVRFHAYCLTCNDPTDTVLQLVEGVTKAQAMQSAGAHERAQGYGHSILVDYSFSEIPAQDFQYAAKTE